MKYRKPHYYDEFQCAADKCPDTCCGGWKIAIDEEELWNYSRVGGPFGNRLYASIDWEEGTFCQEKGKCSLLNEQKLCDLYIELGEAAMCSTCRKYPRHVEEFKEQRELSLSLSCPVAAGMILTSRKPSEPVEWETDEKEELAEEFEEFDGELFTVLLAARKVIFAVLQDGQTALEDRIAKVLELAYRLQLCLDEGRLCDMAEDGGSDMDQVIRDWCKTAKLCMEETAVRQGKKESRYTKMCREYTVFGRMEQLREEWSDLLKEAWMVLYERGEDTYMEICREFDIRLTKSSEKEEWELFTQNLMSFFIYTYFCGAVYDDWIYSKAALAEFSVRWIRELAMARLNADRSLSVREAYAEAAYRYAREIEHSDENLNILEEWLTENMPESPK